MTLQTRIQASRRSPTVLIAGGAGFIGSHLCDALLQRGHTVICLDNLFTGTIGNIRPLLNHPNFRFIEHDVRDPVEIEGDIDGIYSLACPASPRHYQKDPVGTMKTCVLGTINMLELARRKGARVLQASTSEVYGDPEVHPQPESYLGNVNAIGPRACYDEGKRAAETLMFDYHRMYGVEIKIARIFNTYGPRMLENDGRVVYQLHRAGTARRADHDLWRWYADQKLLLRRRSRARPPAAHGESIISHRALQFG
ncbi:nucleoside-diphosphate-sugar epimerase [Bradyrhizobium sp. LB7.2]